MDRIRVLFKTGKSRKFDNVHRFIVRAGFLHIYYGSLHEAIDMDFIDEIQGDEA